MRNGQTSFATAYRGEGRDGFLLVEVLATMTISALLLAALFSITSMTLRASARVERGAQHVEERTRFLAALTREIERAVPTRWAGKDGAFIFVGSERSLAFAIDLPLTDGSTEAAAVFIDASSTVTRRTAVVGPTATSFAELAISRPEIMSSSAYRLSFAYFTRLADGREALVETWPDASQFPVAVQVTLSDRNGERSSKRVKFRVDAEPGCGFPATGRCGLRPVKTLNVATSAAIGGG